MWAMGMRNPPRQKMWICAHIGASRHDGARRKNECVGVKFFFQVGFFFKKP
jgi:hypothetical protein